MISVVIPTLNEEKYVGKLLSCLCSQTFRHFEVIVVDGNSDDGTARVVKSFSKKLTIKLVNSTKRNVSVQRNIGVSQARFNQLLFLDADVIIGKDFIKNMNNISFGTVKILPYNGKWYDKAFFMTINILFYLLHRIKPYAIGSCIVSNKKLHKSVRGFDEKITFCEDFDYVRRSSKYSGFVFDNKNRVFVSIRRFEEKGTKNTMRLWMKSFFYNLFTNKYLEVDYGW
ncbi:MAG: glycosyltransferase [Nanoarchaeota archaeon]|nr:glycosyltransferase [Nanoarchaeota archaeon]MBU1703920.1 glycosyltransferase [Nanoarchaeota archaeon]